MKRYITSLGLLISAACLVTLCHGQTSTQAPISNHSKNCTADASGNPVLFIWDIENLKKSRAKITANDKSIKPAYDAMIELAKKELAKDAYSVTNKTKTPPSGSKNDYYSIGPYWWPNPQKKSGLPYIRRDGETNPERYDDSFDSDRFSNFSHGVENLTLAAYLSQNKIYAQKAAEFVRAWFINPDTRMNPNMDYTQSIPGKTDGRGIGIIDSYRFVRIIDSLGMLEHMGAISTAEAALIKDWFAQYSLWMLTSENGKESRSSVNNHGIYYDVQLMAFSAYAGDLDAVKIIANGVKASRIPGQINKKGQLPLELRRTRAFHYTAFAIRAFLDAADIAECVGVDLWSFETPKNQGIKQAMAYQTRFANNMKIWPFKEIRKYTNMRGYYQNLRRVDDIYNDINFYPAKTTLSERYKSDISNLIEP
jgi:hypothetical protein